MTVARRCAPNGKSSGRAHLFPADPKGNIPLRPRVIGSFFGDFESLTPLRNVNYTDVWCSGLILGREGGPRVCEEGSDVLGHSVRA